MRNKKILTIEDLVKFCEEKNFTEFNSKESGYSLHVQVPCENFTKSDDDDPLTFYGNIKLMHTGRNRNKSTLTEKAAKNCLTKIAYKPVLADFTEVNGERDFTYHAMEFNDDGSRSYIEKQVGCFTSDKPYMEQDSEHEDRQYIFAKVAIPREYTDAAEIIERKGGTKVSAELAVNEMSYSVDEGLLLEDVDVMGVTLLGTDPNTGDAVQEGMEGAFLQIEDFSAANNSIVNKAQLIDEITAEVLNRLDYKKADYSADNNYGKEEFEVDNFENKPEEVTEEIEVTKAMEETTEEETVVETEASKEVTEETAEDTPEVVEKVSEEEFADDDPAADDPAADDPGTEDPETGDDEESEEETEEHQTVSAIEDEDSTPARVENSLTYTVNVNGVSKEFSVSLREKINALTELFNDTYCEQDNTWYDVDVYEEEKYVIAHDWWGDHHYKQEYSVKKDVYSLKGDRVEVYAQYLTKDQIAQLDKLKSDFTAISDELSQYKTKELHAAREAVLASEDYSVLSEYADFKDLKEHMDDYSVDELTEAADLVYAKFMKSNYSTFSAKAQEKHGVVFMTSGENTEEERLPYGGLFKNFKKGNK